jgi:hypothetical protein
MTDPRSCPGHERILHLFVRCQCGLVLDAFDSGTHQRFCPEVIALSLVGHAAKRADQWRRARPLLAEVR